MKKNSKDFCLFWLFSFSINQNSWLYLFPFELLKLFWEESSRKAHCKMKMSWIMMSRADVWTSAKILVWQGHICVFVPINFFNLCTVTTICWSKFIKFARRNQKISPKMTEVKKFSLAEVREHNKSTDIWIIIRDKVYDVTRFLTEVSFPLEPKNVNKIQLFSLFSDSIQGAKKCSSKWQEKMQRRILMMLDTVLLQCNHSNSDEINHKFKYLQSYFVIFQFAVEWLFRWWCYRWGQQVETK